MMLQISKLKKILQRMMLPYCKACFHPPLRPISNIPLMALCVAILGLLDALPAHAQDTYPFRIETQQDGMNFSLRAINEGPAPISVRLELTGENFVSTPQTPLETVIPSFSHDLIAQVEAADPHQPVHFNERHHWIPGDIQAQPDQDYAYRLPFVDGGRFVISQADDGPLTTHKGDDLKYAVDFSMPVGTPVLAAREGVVIEVKDGFTAGGNDPALLDKANAIRVLHPDGGIAEYAHLQNGSITVQAGQPVVAGQQLARSGDTGYSTGPHLHFAVTELYTDAEGAFHSRAIPLTFTAYKPGITFAPQTRHLAVADYSDPPPRDAAQASPAEPAAQAALPATPPSGAPAPSTPEAPRFAQLLRSPGGHLAGILVAALVVLWLLRRRR